MSDERAVTVAAHIAEQLGEVEELPRLQIAKVVELVGIERAMGFLIRAEQIEADGGLMLPAKARRRTFGGVFFFLVRRGVSDKQRRQIFGKRYNQERAPQTPVAPPFRWADYPAILDQFKGDTGVADSLVVEVKGRPGRVIDRERVVIVRMERNYDGGALPGVSSDIPLPARIPAVPCVVLIRRKSWNKVKDALDADENDRLIAKGPAFYDADHRVFTIAATVVTTIAIERERRASSTSPDPTP